MKHIYHSTSKIDRIGLFAGENIKKDEVIQHIKGEIKLFVPRNKKESLTYPDWIGIGKHRWIDPQYPNKYLNHSCNPNSSIKGKVTMVALKNEFKTEVGVSDHTIGEECGGDDPLGGITVPLVAVVLGGVIVEKHFTDDTKRKGNDHPFAMNAVVFKKMVDSIRAVEKTFGDSQKRVLESEKETVIIQRRGIYAKNDIEDGEEITNDKIEFLRPALFMRPPQVENILGKKAKYKINAGDPIKSDIV